MTVYPLLQLTRLVSASAVLDDGDDDGDVRLAGFASSGLSSTVLISAAMLSDDVTRSSAHLFMDELIVIDVIVVPS